MLASSPLECLKDELHYNPQMAVQSIGRLRVIGMALGPEQTRTELLPYLTAEIQQGNLNNEVLLALADVLGSFVDFVGTKEDARCLLAPLRELSCVEETAVREQAVHAVRCIGSALPEEIVASQLISMVLSLGRQQDWFTPRISACGLLPLAVELSVRSNAGIGGCASPASSLTTSLTTSPATPTFISLSSGAMTSSVTEGLGSLCGCSTSPIASACGEPGQAEAMSAGAAAKPSPGGGGAPSASSREHKQLTSELMALFRLLCADDDLSVRRAAAANMADLAKALGDAAAIGAEIAPTYAHMLTDEAEPVRIAVLSASAAVAAAVSLGDGHAAATRLVGASRDKSPLVRVAVAEALPGVARADAGAAALARDIAICLVEDVDVDVRIATALQAAALAEGVGGEFVASVLLPTLDELVRDESVGARVELVGVLMSLAWPLGALEAATHIVPLIQLLLDDANTNVRLSIVYRLADLIDVVGVDCAIDGEERGLMTMLASLSNDSNWRVRHATLLLLPTLAAVLPPEEFARSLGIVTTAVFEHFSTDSCALIRCDWVKACASIAKLPAYSSAWLEADVLPVLIARHGDVHNYQRRAVLLDGLATLAPHLDGRALEEELLPLALSMASDKVPNLRLLLAEALQKAAPHLSGSVLISQVMPALRELERDEDIDVLGAATGALNTCLALTNS